MKSIYSDAELWINEEQTHVAVYLAGDLWDIDGPVSEGHYADEDFHKASLEEKEIAEAFGWGLYCQGWECPNCDGIYAYKELRKAQAVSQRYVKAPDGQVVKEVRYFEPAEKIEFINVERSSIQFEEADHE